ncbi:uncharacterized protein LOC113053504 isoform X1 [Carassius auratus]|uniref:Uncharacterized protein LOC113053504 isoform X1 n=1 Tax=Carassius auratus TaxID=7957 RepID=A0A6P6KSD2_CARAU|nr:uncharacterized protein LOC113053504 isoform X1 [Carassius auratus]XP_026074381.1 uncharacterized protein LOC113053504 isoform X1 [Carassius auratus]
MKCNLCQHKMKLTHKPNKADNYVWSCTRNRHKGRFKSVRYGSLFAKSKCNLFSWMKFIYRFAQGLQLRQIDMIEDGIAGSSRTLSSMAKKVRAICKESMKLYARRKGQMIGQPREFVMIDESNFRHKRKYGRGRFAKTWRRRKWVFGMLGVAPRNSKPILKLVHRRSRNHLIPHIVRHVHPGSSILSDEWRAYRGVLTDLGYNHFPVKHNQCFVDPITGSHTQNLERAWLTYKGKIWRLRGNRTEDLLKQHLKLIEWTYWLGNRYKNGPLGRLLKDIHRKYHL